jgi:uncharacterized membrane protein HdeD (DUF308 family)
MSSIAAVAQRTLGRALPPWWLFLLTAIGWMLVALIVLRFDYTSVNAIAILFGIVAIAAGVLEIGVTMLAQRVGYTNSVQMRQLFAFARESSLRTPQARSVEKPFAL